MTLSRRRRLPDTPFNPDAQLKAALSGAFLRDALVHRDRFLILDVAERNAVRAYRSKLFGDLLMMIECALKSLCFSLSQTGETPEEVYKKVKRLSHGVHELALEVRRRAKGKARFMSDRDIEILRQAQERGVGWRYDTQAIFSIMEEDYVRRLTEQGPIFGTVESEAWMRTLWTVAKQVKEVAVAQDRKHCSRHRMTSGADLGKREERFKRFAREVRIVRA